MNIMVIDDNPDDRLLAIRELNQSFRQLNIHEITNADEFDNALLSQQFDAFITDYQLKWSNGLEIFRQIRARNLSEPVIIFTNSGTQEIAVEAMHLGVDDYIVKSSTQFVQLPIALRNALQRHQSVVLAQKFEQRTRTALNVLLELTKEYVQVDFDSAEVDGEEYTKRIAHRICTIVADLFQCDRASLTAVSSIDEPLELLALVGADAEKIKQYRDQLHRFTFAEYGSALESLYVKGEILVLELDRFTALGLPTLDSSAALLAPIKVGDRLLGVLSLDFSDREHIYDASDIELAAMLAQLAAILLERRNLRRERDLARASELAVQEINRRMDEFLSIASHELRMPIATIKTGYQLLQNRLNLISQDYSQCPDDIRSFLELAPKLLLYGNSETQKMEQLVTDLLDSAKIQSSALDMKLAPCDVQSIVKEIFEQYCMTFPHRKITLDANGMAMYVMADAVRLGQVLGNFLNNAIKFSHDDSEIAISVVKHKSKFRVAVKDEGPGIDAVEQQMIWNRFYQIKSMRHQSGSQVGLGLGLHICRSIIEQHSGIIGVQSTINNGSTFWFELPKMRNGPV